ncbi:MAG: hypothetical protein WB297_12380 [Actinomycetota bacterium]
MSTTISGPRTPVILRITRSGSAYLAESRAGVAHPFTQSVAAGPCVAGDSSGRAGGVGDAVEPVPDVGVTGGEIDGASGPVSPVHAASESTMPVTAIAPENVVENLC